MINDFKTFCEKFFSTRKIEKVGFIIGVLLGAVILFFGVFDTMFIVLCGFAGVFICSRLVGDGELYKKILNKLHDALPEKIKH